MTSSNKVPETNQILITMIELPDREFKTTVLRKLNELEKNKEKCFNTLIEKLKDVEAIKKKLS
jgi:hypothetical protein